MPVVAAAAARVTGTVLARVIPPLSTNVTVSSSASPSATAATVPPRAGPVKTA